MKNVNDPSLFRKLSEPHESSDALDAALDAFQKDVAAARERHGLLNVVVIVASPALDEGQERNYQTRFSLGDSLRVPYLLAQALGDEERDFERTIEAIKAGKGGRR